ncbi:dihydrofolate synthase/folylpolyglutamate synthase [Dongia mobilis]|uniref:tetrahydrofolate synthase n=2 Tax=Dongia mobilis TaxID=578943 RepID=A0A4R6WQ95_9PROT|nr:dihydrofolate synthase/folylpolyglutamate synthase [Dongia mobilis]
MGQTSDIVLERLNKLHPKLIDLELTRVQNLLAAVGHPERRLPPTIHVAGTNGKGSVIAYLRAMLEAAGYRVHVYTSPHLVRFHERIRLNGELIAEEALIALLEECERANGGTPITFFEITTVAAFLAFTRQPADILLLETGLGGEFDATNVIDAPLATVQMPISFDHMQFLGDSLAKIATAKAGIIKRHRPVVISPQPAEAMAVFEARAAALQAPLYRFGREWNCDGDLKSQLRYFDARGPRLYPAPGLAGRHQYRNAGCAVATTGVLEGFKISDAHIAQGLRDVTWPARMQRLTRGPLVEMLPDGTWELWLDGGHNAEAGEVIAGMLADWRITDGKPAHLIFGMLNTKDPVAFLAQLAPHAEDLAAVAIPGDHASLSVEECVAAAAQVGLLAHGYRSVEAALRAIIDAHDGSTEPRRILICGSLYLAGTVLAENS